MVAVYAIIVKRDSDSIYTIITMYTIHGVSEGEREIETLSHRVVVILNLFPMIPGRP